MNFMLSCRQPLTVLKGVSEIKVDYKDINRIADFATNDWQCKAAINIYIPNKTEIDWQKINNYKDVLNLVFALEDTDQFDEVKAHGFTKYFWSYPVTTFYELQGLIDLGVSQVLLDAPLFFQLPIVKSVCKKIEIRLIVNRCFNGYMKRKNGICGTYIRPEDVEVYAQYVDHLEFDIDTLEKELTLYNIYTIDKKWPGNLNMLLSYLNYHVDNRGFDNLPNPTGEQHYFAKRRINCGQRCQESPRRCNFCPTVFELITQLDQNTDWLDKKIKT